MSRIVLASGNKAKLREMRALLAEKRVELLSQDEFDVDAADETGLSFVENAIIKARHACRETGLAAIADDSGLEVDALDGAPGIYSARYADCEGHGADEENNLKLLSELEQVPEGERSARFQCAVVLMRHADDPMPLVCQGTWEGRILFRPRGENGFGYDPLFFVPGENCTSAELPPVRKNALSHRAQAIGKLLSCWNYPH